MPVPGGAERGHVRVVRRDAMRGVAAQQWRLRLELLEQVIKFVDNVGAPVPGERIWLLKVLHVTRRRATFALMLAERQGR